jgi:hypothetical protein
MHQTILSTLALSIFLSCGVTAQTTIIPGKVEVTPKLRTDLEKAIRSKNFRCPAVTAIYEDGKVVWCTNEPFRRGDEIYRYQVGKGADGKILISPMLAPR